MNATTESFLDLLLTIEKTPKGLLTSQVDGNSTPRALLFQEQRCRRCDHSNVHPIKKIRD